MGRDGASAPWVCHIVGGLNGRISIPLDHSSPQAASECPLFDQQGWTLAHLCCDYERKGVGVGVGAGAQSSTHLGLGIAISKASFTKWAPCLGTKGRLKKCLLPTSVTASGSTKFGTLEGQFLRTKWVVFIVSIILWIQNDMNRPWGQLEFSGIFLDFINICKNHPK